MSRRVIVAGYLVGFSSIAGVCAALAAHQPAMAGLAGGGFVTGAGLIGEGNVLESYANQGIR